MRTGPSWGASELFNHAKFIDGAMQRPKEEALRRITTRIVNEIDDASRCVHNLADKSPPTIKHE
jgi:GMP synthase PP-ATPase subunit